MRKTFAVLGGDLRQLRLAQLLEQDGQIVYRYGFDQEPEQSSLERAVTADVVILPLPISKDGHTLYLPFSTATIALEDLWPFLDSRRQLVCGGNLQEPLRQLVLNAPKYGNNDPYADGIARDLDAMIMTLVHNYKSVFGEKYAKYVPVTSHVGLGNKTWATPNGRHAHTFLSEGISPTQGADVNGPLCTMISIANSTSRVFPNSCARLLNLKLNPQVVSGEKGTTDLMNLIRNFVDLKLWHVQIGIYNKEVLLKAREHPEDYKNLIVRVAGYSAYFVELSPSMQGEIIARTEHEMV